MYDATCVIGGISLAGGKGCIVGSIISALIIAVWIDLASKNGAIVT